MLSSMGYNPLLSFSLVRLSQIWPLGTLPMFFHVPIIFQALSYFLASHGTPGSTCIRLDPAQEFKEPHFLLLENNI